MSVTAGASAVAVAAVDVLAPAPRAVQIVWLSGMVVRSGLVSSGGSGVTFTARSPRARSRDGTGGCAMGIAAVRRFEAPSAIARAGVATAVASMRPLPVKGLTSVRSVVLKSNSNPAAIKPSTTTKAPTGETSVLSAEDRDWPTRPPPERSAASVAPWPHTRWIIPSPATKTTRPPTIVTADP